MRQVGFAYVKDYDTNPREIFANDLPKMSKPVIVNQGQVLVEGTVMGRVTATGKSVKAANDGSEKPRGILAFDLDTTAADTRAEIFTAGGFIGKNLTLGAGWTVADIAAAFEGTPIHIVLATN